MTTNIKATKGTPDAVMPGKRQTTTGAATKGTGGMPAQPPATREIKKDTAAVTRTTAASTKPAGSMRTTAATAPTTSIWWRTSGGASG